MKRRSILLILSAVFGFTAMAQDREASRRDDVSGGGHPASVAPKPGKSSWARKKKKIHVRDLDMAYYEVGEGDPIIFLHGNPTSSYLWRNVIPHVKHLGRCIAPDMVGMGDSDPLPDSGPGKYTFVVQRDYMFALFDALGVKDKVTLVVHDWGSAIGLSWAQKHPDRVKGIAYCESIFREPAKPWPAATRGPFALMRSPAGEKAVLEKNLFIERLFLPSLKYYLTDEDRAEYRRPYLQPGESRRPTLAWPRELPLGGQPKINDDLIKSYTVWFSKDERIPKLLIHRLPASAESLRFVRSFKHQREVGLYGPHFIQEVSPHAMGRALAEWMTSQ